MSIGNGSRALNFLSDPVSTDSLQHPCRIAVRDDECVVAIQVVDVATIATEDLALDKASDDRQRFVGIARSLQSEANQIQTAQPGAPVTGQPGEDGFVADDQPMLIHTHFGSPIPKWFAQQDAVGSRHLGDVDIGAAHAAAGLVIGGVHDDHFLGLIGMPVTVFCEQKGAIGGGCWQSYEGVTHDCRPEATGRTGGSKSVVRESSVSDMPPFGARPRVASRRMGAQRWARPLQVFCCPGAPVGLGSRSGGASA